MDLNEGDAAARGTDGHDLVVPAILAGAERDLGQAVGTALGGEGAERGGTEGDHGAGSRAHREHLRGERQRADDLLRAADGLHRRCPGVLAAIGVRRTTLDS